MMPKTAHAFRHHILAIKIELTAFAGSAANPGLSVENSASFKRLRA
ncbi:hypothetical protein [Rhizobium ruizarguesonis]